MYKIICYSFLTFIYLIVKINSCFTKGNIICFLYWFVIINGLLLEAIHNMVHTAKSRVEFQPKIDTYINH